MPNRIIKESIRTSKSINLLNDFQFRVWLYLITYVDDYGRGSADPELLKGFVFPRRKSVTEAQIEKALADLATFGMINLYEVDGESFFCFPNWHQHQRIQSKQSKFPEPVTACHNESPQVTVGHGESPPEYESNTEDIKRKENIKRKEKAPEVSEDMLGGFSGELREAVEDWLKYKAERRQAYKETGLKSVLTQISKNAKLYGDAAVADVIRQSMANNYQGITFDKLKNKPKSFQSVSQSVAKAQPQRTVTDADLVEYPYGSGKWMPYWEADKLREAGK